MSDTDGQLALPIVAWFDTPGRPPCPGDPDGVHLYGTKEDECKHCGLAYDAIE